MTDRSQNDVKGDTDAEPQASSPSKTAKTNRILVVDDEEAVRKIIASMLASANFECREAASGLEALALLKSGEQFDLILTDLMMPGMDGAEFMGRTQKNYPDLPVIIVSAVHDISVALQTLRDGASDYLLKPFEQEQLIGVVRRALESRRLKLENRAYVSGLEAQVATLTRQLKSSRKNR
jgi:DNA-binding NtrC family response regulator